MRRRQFALVVFLAVGTFVTSAVADASKPTSAPGQTAPVNTTLPSISGTPVLGATLTASPGTWNGPTLGYAYQYARCDSTGASCAPITLATTQTYVVGNADVGMTLRVIVTATNKNGSAVATSNQMSVITSPLQTPGATTSTTTSSTATTTTPPSTTTTSSSTTVPSTTTTSPSSSTSTTTTGIYFGTGASGNATSKAGPSSTPYPRDATYCASNIIQTSWEPRSDNYPANGTVGDGSYTFSQSDVSPTYWSGWGNNMGQVQGQFTGTTTEMFSWAACRWGIDENTLRAVGVQESNWHMSTVGDNCGVTGEASYGIMQIKNAFCNGALAWGGYPDTQQSTALNLDFYAAYIRSCYDGDFYDGRSWLYGGRTVGQVAATSGWSYVLWGCVGSWFSGGWYDSGAQSYIASVQAHLANKDWLKY